MIEQVRQAKREMRKEVKKRLSLLPAEIQEKESMAVAETVMSLEAWKGAKRVFLFLSMPGEVDTGMLLRRALEEGKTVAVPRMEGDDIHFYFIGSEAGPFNRHPYGIREPVPEPGVLEMEPVNRHEDLVISPGAAFTENGDRLGYGKGFYDRFFSRYWGKFVSIGICFSCQVFDSLPADSTDVQVMGLVAGGELLKR
jgi:5-formyltetrahydrofolate cyclo-ligase